MKSSPRVAVYVSSHGYGHAIRVGNLLNALVREQPLDIIVFSSAPRSLWPEPVHARVVEWNEEATDPGVVQSDELTVDLDATRGAIEAWLSGYKATVGRHAERLAGDVKLVFGDVPPLAFDAAAEAKVPSVAMANFSWDWIYEEMGFEPAAMRAAEAYQRASVLLRLQPAAPMPAFANVVDCGNLGRLPKRNRHNVRQALSLTLEERLVALALKGGVQSLVSLPPRSAELRYLSFDGSVKRDDVIEAPPDLDFIEAVHACDVVVGKPGYGILADVATTATPFLYTDRQGFPEHQVLCDWIESNDLGLRVSPESLRKGTWLASLETLLARERQAPTPGGDMKTAVETIRRFL